MRTIKQALMLGAVLTLGGTAYGAGVCASGFDGDFGVTETLTLTDDTEAPCNVGGNTFSNFQVLYASGPGNFSFSISVIEQDNGIGFSYSNLTGRSIQLSFEVTPGLSSIGLSSATSSITEVICTVAFDPSQGQTCLNQGGTQIGFGEVTPQGVTNVVIPINQQVGTMFVVKSIGGGGDAFQTVSEIPEPMTSSLVGLGLLGIGLVARRRAKK